MDRKGLFYKSFLLTMRQLNFGFAVSLLLLIIGSSVHAQVVSNDPNFTPSLLAGGLQGPANGVVFRSSTNDVLVTEFLGHRVSRINAITGAVAFFTGMDSPDDMAINSLGEVFVKSHPNGPISRFNSSGTFLSSFPGPTNPVGAAFDSSDNFYIADSVNGIIFKFAAGTFSSPTIFASGFPNLIGIAISPSGKMFAADLFAGKVYEVTPGGTNISSHILWASGLSGGPVNFAFDPFSSNIYVSNGPTVMRMSAPGAVTTFATGFSPVSIFFGAIDLDFDSAGNLYVDDFGRGELWKFTRTLFNVCIQNNINGDLVQFNSNTGNYLFSNCTGLTLGGTGTMIVRGGIITLQDFRSDRRVLIRVDTASHRATASIQVFSLGITFTITDRDTTNGNCSCQAGT